MRNFLKDDSGQAAVEYVLMLSLAVSGILFMGSRFRKILVKVWESMARAVAAPCPGCQAGPEVRIR